MNAHEDRYGLRGAAEEIGESAVDGRCGTALMAAAALALACLAALVSFHGGGDICAHFEAPYASAARRAAGAGAGGGGNDEEEADALKL